MNIATIIVLALIIVGVCAAIKMVHKQKDCSCDGCTRSCSKRVK